jgi:ech hydrogenase subunit D
MNAPAQTYVTVEPAALLEEVRERQLEGCRLVQICCTHLPAGFEMTYSFARTGVFTHVRLQVPDAHVKVPSISPIFSASFAYENEIHDLFGLTFLGLNIDYRGNFYRKTIPAPFANAPVCGVPAKPPAPAAGGAAT